MVLDGVKKPWILMPSGPLGWSSHRYIVPSLLDVWTGLGAHIEYLWFPRPVITKKWIQKIKNEASHLVFPIGISHYEALWTLRQLRENHGVELAAVLMLAADLTKGYNTVFENRLVLSSNDRFVTNCSVEKKLAELAFHHSSRVMAIPLPVSEIFKPVSKEERLSFKESLGLSPNDLFILYAGRISAQKNVHGLLSTFSLFLKNHKNAKLFILGPHDDIGLPHFGQARNTRYANEICTLITDLKIDRSVVFRGEVTQEELTKYLSACDVNITLSLHSGEDFGYSIAQGLACGAPTIVSGWGGGIDFSGPTGGAIRVPVTVSENGPRVCNLTAVQALVRLTDFEENAKWRLRALAFAKKKLSLEYARLKWSEILELQQTCPRQNLKLNKMYLNNYLDSFTRQVRGFQSADDELYLKITKIYAAQNHTSLKKIKRGQKVYFHPLFDLKKNMLRDSTAMETDLSLSPTEKRQISKHIGRKNEIVSIKFSEIKTRSWTKKLIKSGVLLPVLD